MLICQPAREVTFTSAHHILTNQTKENIFCVTEKHGIVERNRDHVPKFEERMGQKATEFRQMWRLSYKIKGLYTIRIEL